MKTPLLLVLLCWQVLSLPAQSKFCPPNIDFENGNLDHWQCFSGTCCPLTFSAPIAPLPGRFAITQGLAKDPYGLFPVVAPGGGVHSLKLGNDSSGAEAEKIRYTFTIPQGLNNYSLIYRFAVVFEDPNHQVTDQPRFVVQIFDSATQTVMPCANHTYIAGGGLPGFKVSPINADVLYREWSIASIDLSGMAGKTVIAEFSTGDCGLGGHFGYGYIDISCGLYEAEALSCLSDSMVNLSAPPGFATYSWFDASLTQWMGNGRELKLPKPPGNGQYMVILSPYPGYGCPDTLETNINYAAFSVLVNPEIEVCHHDSFLLKAVAVSESPQVQYVWTPNTNMFCDQCAETAVLPGSQAQQYTVTATNAAGCITRAIVNVTPGYKACCEDVFIPNAFTPNADELNDVFKIRTNLDIDVKNWVVYDRWGKQLWHSTRYYDKWDGNFEGEAQPMGVYFYIFEYTCLGNGKTYLLKGDLTLLR